MTAPAIGTFLRPVAATPRCYCERVDAVTREAYYDETELHEFVRCTRFGLDESGTPIADGHQTKRHLRDLVAVRPGVWREPRAKHWYGDTLYWREIHVPGQQLGLFSEVAA
jgi:hypothetical protein